MTNDSQNPDEEYAKSVFRKLNSFLELDIPVFFKLFSGLWRKGKIIDLSISKLTLVIKDDVLGMIPILLEEIDEKTICAKRELNKEGDKDVAKRENTGK